MCRTCGKRHNSYVLDPSSGVPQDVSINETGGSIPFSLAIRSPGKLSPLRGRNMKDFEDNLEHLKKENFSLKLRIYFLEERMSQKIIQEDKEDLHKTNIELKVETEALRKELHDKQELVRQASGLLTTLEDQYKNQLYQIQSQNEKDKEDLKTKVSQLEKEIEELPQKCRYDPNHIPAGDLTQLCGLAFSNAGEQDVPTSGDFFSRTEGVDRHGIKMSPCRPTDLPGVTPATLQGIFSLPDEAGHNSELSSPKSPKRLIYEEDVVPEKSSRRIRDLEKRVKELETKVVDLEDELGEKERTSVALEEDLSNIKKELQDQEEKVIDLETEVNEKDQKVDQLMQDLETRRREIQAKDSSIQTLRDDLNKVEPEIEVKVQEIVERDRIIEEKIEQLQQQNKILVEIQITLDEKQKQIAELESSLQEAQTKAASLSKELHVSCEMIKGLADKVVDRDKEIAMLKKDLKKREKKVRDLGAELKEALDMLKKAKWEAETSGGEDGVKEMVEEENERLWAELEQRKAEAYNLRAERDSAIKLAEAKIELFQQKANEAEEKLKALQALLGDQSHRKSAERDKGATMTEGELAALREKAVSRDTTLREQEGVIENLKGELRRAREEIFGNKEEMRDLKKELSMKNANVQDIITQQLFGRSKEVKDLQGRLCNFDQDKDKHLEALKDFLKSTKLNAVDGSTKPNTQIQARSNSMTQIKDLVPSSKIEGHSSQSGTRAGRSNSFSLLENALYAHMGQKVYNTNQTFNTYVMPGTADNKPTDVASTNEVSNALPNHAADEINSCVQNALAIRHKELAGDMTVAPENSLSAGSLNPMGTNTSETSKHILNDSCHSEGTDTIQVLYEEMNNLRDEVKALKQERGILHDKLKYLQSKHKHEEPENEQITKLKQFVNPQNQTFTKAKHYEIGEIDPKKQIDNLKEELKQTKKKITLQVFELASQKYQNSVKNYKQEIASLRKRLADSHNACDILRTRLEELVDFLEQILEMDRNGIINLSHIPPSRMASLNKTLEESRALSHSLSQSLMIGADSTSFSPPQEDSPFNLPLGRLPEEVDLSNVSHALHRESSLSLPEEISQLDLSFDFSVEKQHEDLLYQKISTALNNQIDTKTQEIDDISIKLNQLSEVIQQKDEAIKEQTCSISKLQKDIQLLHEEMRQKDELLRKTLMPGCVRSEIYKDTCRGDLKLGELDQHYTDVKELSNNSFPTTFPSVQDQSVPLLSNVSSQNCIFITQDRQNAGSSIANICPTSPSHDKQHGDFNFLKPACSDHDLELCKDHQSDSTLCSAYSTDVMIKNLFLPRNSVVSLQPNTSSLDKLSRKDELAVDLEQPNPPIHMLASPSESEAWSEPDRNVSLARIGLDACALTTNSHDRSLSRARINRSTPLSSESDAEVNFETMKESTSAQGVLTTAVKVKRRTEAAEIKRLSAKLKNIEQLNETLRAELHIYQTLNQHFSCPKQETRSTQVCKDVIAPNSESSLEAYQEVSRDLAVCEEIGGSSLTISSPLLQEIRSLRMKLEEAIANNDLLRDQLEAALAGYLNEETRSLTATLASTQLELQSNKDQLMAASKTELLLKNQIRETESKSIELSEGAAECLYRNEEQKMVISQLQGDIVTLQTTYSSKDEELSLLRSLYDEETEQYHLNSSRLEQLQIEISNIRSKLHNSQQSEVEKDGKINQQTIHISSLEEAKADCDSRLIEQDAAINNLCQSITNLQNENRFPVSDKVVQKLQEALQASECRLLQVTKEKFSLHSEKSRLQAQLASVSTRARLLQQNIQEMSESEENNYSEPEFGRVIQRLNDYQSTIKVLEGEKSVLASEKQALRKELELLQEEVVALQAQVDHLRTREAISYSKEAGEFVKLQSSNKHLQGKQIILLEKLSAASSEKEKLEMDVNKLHSKNSRLQLILSQQKQETASLQGVKSQLEAEKRFTSNLQMDIKNLQAKLLAYNLDATPTRSDLTSPVSTTSIEFYRPDERSHLDTFPPPLRERKRSEYSFSDNKENVIERAFRSFHTMDGTSRESFKHDGQHHSIDDDATSNESPDLGIGSDGQFSSLERRVRSTKVFASKDKCMEKKTQLCTDPSHSQLIQGIERLQNQKEELNLKLLSSKEALQDALDELSRANKRKESVERAICRQLTKTHDVLKRAKGNLHQTKGQSLPKIQTLSAS